jgi:hypothetical protein
MLSAISSFSVWDWLQVVGTAMVLVGVAGELVSEFKRFPFNPTRFPPLESSKRRIEISSLIVLILGLLLEIVALPHSIVEAGDARKSAGEANERASTNEVHFAELTRSNLLLSANVEELKSNNIELRAQMSPRLIDVHELGINLGPTATSGRSKMLVSPAKFIVISASGGDCPDLAAKIGEALFFAHWDCASIIITPKHVPDGITVGICSTNGDMDDTLFRLSRLSPNIYESADALVGALTNIALYAKYDSRINFRTTLRFNGVLITVGPKPFPEAVGSNKRESNESYEQSVMYNNNLPEPVFRTDPTSGGSMLP